MPRTWIVLLLVALLASCSKKTPPPKTPADVATPPKVTDDQAKKAEPAAAPAEEAKPAPFDLDKTAYFEFDSATLSDVARDELAHNAKWLEKHPGESLLIEGHTCEIGTTEYNLALGERRARAAQDYLVALGVDKSRIKIISYGEERPADPNNLERNRRDEFVARPGGQSNK